MTRFIRSSYIVGSIVVVALVLGYLYSFLIQRGDQPLLLAGSITPAANAAAKLQGTTQVDNIQLVNVSGRAIRLWHVQLIGYKGIHVNHWRVRGELLHGQEVPPNHGEGKLINVTFNANVMSSTVQDPQYILVTYSYWGIKHTQRLDFSLPN